ncbi:hypothetical protein C2W62_43485 [Candidatus Entotheonella serta]|nr:hypothetical protein C2W62_43485 [Candidatus Entotheonella serta]
MSSHGGAKRVPEKMCIRVGTRRATKTGITSQTWLRHILDPGCRRITEDALKHHGGVQAERNNTQIDLKPREPEL